MGWDEEVGPGGGGPCLGQLRSRGQISILIKETPRGDGRVVKGKGGQMYGSRRRSDFG